MKKGWAILLALFLVLMVATAMADGDLLSEIQARGTLIIGTEGDWSPWTYHDENDVLTGLEIEIGTLISEGLGVKPDFQEAKWDDLLSGLDSGRFDIVCNGVGYTETRAEKYNFSVPYVYMKTALVVAKNNEDIHTFDDLKGHITSNSAGSTYAQLAESKGATVEYVDSLQDTISMLLTGRVDATINALASIEDYLKEHPEAPIKIVDTMPGDLVCYPVRKSDETETLISRINEILEEARQNGKLAEISIRYFDADRTRED